MPCRALTAAAYPRERIPGRMAGAMAISDALGERRTVEVPAGTLEYRERGSGPPIVFAHGAAVNGDLWRRVAPELASSHRTIVPDLPLGGHSIPLRPVADLSLFGAADVLGELHRRARPEDVTLVANDTGGALSQALVEPPSRARVPARAHVVRRVRELPAQGGRVPQARVPRGARALAAHPGDAAAGGAAAADRVRLGHAPADRAADHGVLPGRPAHAMPACAATSPRC